VKRFSVQVNIKYLDDTKPHLQTTEFSLKHQILYFVLDYKYNVVILFLVRYSIQEKNVCIITYHEKNIIFTTGKM